MIELRFKEICKQKGLTQQDIADKMKISRPALSLRLNNNPTLESLEQIANALDVPIYELFIDRNNASIVCPHCGNKIEVSITTK